MNKKELDNVVYRRPFVPLRLHLSNGDIYDVTHPDGIMTTEKFVAIAVGDSLTFVATMHVVEVQPLPTVSA